MGSASRKEGGGMTIAEEQRWFSRPQLAAKFGKSIDWVDARLADGTFTSRKLGGSVFIDMEDVEAVMKGRRRRKAS